MNLNLKLESDFLPELTVRILELAASQNSIDEALEIVEKRIIRQQQQDAQWFICGRGGSHVWLSRQTRSGPVRVAIIAEEEIDLSPAAVEKRNIERIIRDLFRDGGLWRAYSIKRERIVEVVRAIDNYQHLDGRVADVLTKLVHQKFLRSRLHADVRHYEANY